MRQRDYHGRFLPNPKESPRDCACGCKQITTNFRGKARKYITGHNSYKENPFKGRIHNILSKKIMSIKHLGITPANYKGGTQGERHKLMGQTDYILWRTAVFMRDNYTCQNCGKHGGKLEADHIKPWSLYPELRYAINNGRTLCKPCHRQTPTWGYNAEIRRRIAS